MTKPLSAYQEAIQADERFDTLGGFPRDFAQKISRKVPLPQARALLAKFPALIIADGKEAERRGRSFETSHGDALFALPFDERIARARAHVEKSAKPASRDWKFAAALPKSLRREFYELVKREKEYQHGCGEHDVSFKRTMRHLDEILSTPQGRYDWEMRNHIASRRRFEMGEF